MPWSEANEWAIPNPRPDRHYRWISDDPRRLMQWLRSSGEHPGYEIVPASECERLGFPPQYANEATNRIRFGFNILASIPIEEYHRRMAIIRARGAENLASAREKVLAASDALPGVRASLQEPEEMMDRKAHATREGNPRTFLDSRKRGGVSPRVPSED